MTANAAAQPMPGRPLRGAPAEPTTRRSSPRAPGAAPTSARTRERAAHLRVVTPGAEPRTTTAPRPTRTRPARNLTADMQAAKARVAAQAAARTAGARTAGRVVLRTLYLDTADGWIAQGRTLSAKEVWRADYTPLVPAGYRPFVLWCKTYRVPAVGFALVLDAAKWMLVHPVRGPLLILAITAGILTPMAIAALS